MNKGQGSTEYLLLIAGAILVGVTVLILIQFSTATGGDILSNNIFGYSGQIGLNGSTSGDNNPPFPSDTTPPIVSLTNSWWGDQETKMQYSIDEDTSFPITYFIFRGTDPNDMGNIVVTDSTNQTFPQGVTRILRASTTVNVSSVDFSDDGLTNGTTYYYLLAACDNATPNNCAKSLTIPITPNVPQLSFSLIGQEETVFDWSTSPKCSATDYPDLPAHAIRNGNEIILTSPHTENYFWKGTSFDNLQKDCVNNVLSSTNSTNASDFDSLEWLTSLYSDGTTIHGLIHGEYHDTATPCFPNGTATCWYSGITYASAPVSSSTSFSQFNTPNHVVAAPPEAWNQSTMIGRLYGYAEPINIIEKNGYYYLLFLGVQTPGSPAGGMCIARTSNLSDPSSWMAWSGDLQNPQFNIPLKPAYDYSTQPPTPLPGQVHPPCSYLPNVQGLRGSVTWNTYLNKYMLVGIGGYIGNTNECGAYASLSDDLINWSTLTKIKGMDMPHGNNTQLNCLGGWNTGATFNMYPSLIDHDQLNDPTDPNFEKSGQTPHLYWTRINNYLQPTGNDRDLVRQQISLCLQNDPTCNP